MLDTPCKRVCGYLTFVELPVLTSPVPVHLSPATEGSSEFSDGDLDVSRRRSRRSHKAQVNYRETSESEGSQADGKRPRVKARRRVDSSDSEGQHCPSRGRQREA